MFIQLNLHKVFFIKSTFLLNYFTVCGFACHVTCQEKVPAVCPVPSDQSNYLHSCYFFHMKYNFTFEELTIRLL